MAVKVTSIMLGVKDLERSKKFYTEGLGCEVGQDYPQFVNLNLGDGSSTLALYERNAAAQDAGVSAEGQGFTGISFHYIVDDHGSVDDTIKNAVASGGTLVKKAEASQWGGYFGYFADPDGYLWKVASPVRAQPGPASATGTLHVRVVAPRQRHRNRERQPWDIAEPDRRLAFARRALQRERPEWSGPHVRAAEERALPQRIRLARLSEVFRKLLVDQLLIPVM
ncbi:MAG: hypothetical protein E6G04_07320 [Actinobacteria bacterium]|nr:MAG: hypothetical protein E6G04_07320 [Actinomycetota bacterium]